MKHDLKASIKEIAEIASSCPENLQAICFELLLKDLLGQTIKDNQTPQEAVEKNDIKNKEQKEEIETPSQEDFKDSDLHVRTKKFLTDNNLTIKHINQIFYKEGDKVEPLFDDLKTTQLAESQIRISLLQALRNSISTGNLEFNGEHVRSETILRKCYDGNNFTANFKNSKMLFEVFEKYDKKTPTIKLSKEGRSELAKIVSELQ